jgi:hypothetical protein
MFRTLPVSFVIGIALAHFAIGRGAIIGAPHPF